MKKRLIMAAITAALVMLLCSCISVNIPADETADVNPPTVPPAMTAAPNTPAAVVDTPSVPTVIYTEAPATTEPAEEVTSGDSCAYITNISMRMDGETDITFDFVDWLSGDEAEAQYLEDHPGATEQDMEDEGLYEIGYIRNVNTMLRTFHTTPDTRYFLPDDMDMAVNDEVDYDEFRDRMFPAVTEGENGYITFVKVYYIGEEVTRIECLYLP